MENLVKAVLKVMSKVKGMEKNSKVGTGNSSYNGTKYQDVAEVFNEAMAEAELIMLPIDIDETITLDRWEEEDQWSKSTPKAKKTKQSVFTKVKTTYLLMHSSGESKEIVGYGHGIDAQDKGAGKATTYALKNALLYTFLTPVGKMDDSDTTHSNDIATPQSTIPNKADSIKQAISAMNECKSMASLQACWTHYRVYQLEQSFMDAKESMKNKLLKTANKVD